MRNQGRQSGSVTLEAAIILPIFCALFMALNGMFFIFSAQNQITHALVQSANSMGMDAYANEAIESFFDEGWNFWGSLTDLFMDLGRRAMTNGYYTSPDDWYAVGSGSNVAKKRFVAYLTGTDGSSGEGDAQEKLKRLGVENGLSGMDFSVEKEDKDFKITVKYKLSFWFDPFNTAKIPMEQTVKARLWGVK